MSVDFWSSTTDIGRWTLDAISRNFNRFQEPASFIERFLVLALGQAIGDDPRADLNIGVVPLHDERAERDARVHVAGIVDVADGAGIGSAAMRLQLVND